MDRKEYKEALFDGLARLLKAMANPYRLEVIEILAQGEKSVEAIVQSTGTNIANTSQHLQVLKNNNIVKVRKVGHYVYYALINEEMSALYQHITNYAIKEVAELERMIAIQRKENDSTELVSFEELELMVASQNILLLDVRPVDEFDSGHIPGALSLPYNDLIDKLKEFSPNAEIIVYCRGPFCILADETVKILKQEGFTAKRLNGSYPEWKIKQSRYF